MDKERECGCKGRRTCLWCEQNHGLIPDFVLPEELRSRSFVYCSECSAAWSGWDVSVREDHPSHRGDRVDFPGILIVEDFLSTKEASELLQGVDEEPWDVSQSGRRKQNYGPKCNFKKKKLSCGSFSGFPKFTHFVQKKLLEVPLLDNYFVIEQCSLEYDPMKGAAIDPHIDDCWIWGERIVTVNIIGDSLLTLLPYKGDQNKYNLDLVPEFSSKKVDSDFVIRVPMPARSLIVMYGEARYNWEHFILREDITERRVCIAYREFTPPYLPGGHKEQAGKFILEISQNCISTK